MPDLNSIMGKICNYNAFHEYVGGLRGNDKYEPTNLLNNLEHIKSNLVRDKNPKELKLLRAHAKSVEIGIDAQQLIVNFGIAFIGLILTFLLRDFFKPELIIEFGWGALLVGVFMISGIGVICYACNIYKKQKTRVKLVIEILDEILKEEDKEDNSTQEQNTN